MTNMSHSGIASDSQPYTHIRQCTLPLTTSKQQHIITQNSYTPKNLLSMITGCLLGETKKSSYTHGGTEER